MNSNLPRASHLQEPGKENISLPVDSDFQNILISVLQAALLPQSFDKRVDKILDLLLSGRKLQFSEKAAFLLVEQNSETLSLKLSRGFTDNNDLLCNKIYFGQCYCGEVAVTKAISFFAERPPLQKIEPASHNYFGNYCIPIVKDGYTLGVFSIYVSKQHQGGEKITKLLAAVANIFAVMIESKAMDQQLLQLVKELRSSIINLRDEKKFSESIIQGLNHGLIVANMEGRILKSNSAAQTILDPFTNELEGQKLTDFLRPESAESLLTTRASNSDQLDRELVLTTEDGENRILGFSNVSHEDVKGQQVGVIISISDISELKYVRKEMEKMNRLSTVAEIASAVAHEVRNPLAGIKIMAQSIEEDASDNGEQLECSRRIIRQVDRLNVLLNDFFSYARPVVAKKRATSLDAIFAETKPLILNKLTKMRISLQERYQEDVPCIIADPHQVQQVFLNLFLNAMDAIKAEGLIEIRTELLSRQTRQSYLRSHPTLLTEADYVVVHFKDNGTGMPAKVAEQVFEPFFTTKSSGAGLGLSIVYRTLKENDAAIILDSGEGKGTTFTIFFLADT